MAEGRRTPEAMRSADGPSPAAPTRVPARPEAQPWRPALDKVLSDWDQKAIVTSPDVDGILSAALVSSQTGARLAGVYTTSNLLLFDGTTREQARDALWLDHDISHPGVRCIGQHIVNHTPGDTLRRRHSPSFNPNQHYGQARNNSFAGPMKKTRDKYPFATCHFLLAHLGPDEPAPGSRAFALLAHADGSWATAIDYQPNARQWLDFMFDRRSEILRVLCSGEYATDAYRPVHAALVTDLKALKFPAKGSREGESKHVPEDWKPFEGHQTIGHAANRDPAEWLARFTAAARYIVTATGWSLPKPHQVTTAIHCKVDDAKPYRIPDGTFDAWLDKTDVFSHAIKSRREIRYTVNPVL